MYWERYPSEGVESQGLSNFIIHVRKKSQIHDQEESRFVWWGFADKAEGNIQPYE
jgi:hypothetical protein